MRCVESSRVDLFFKIVHVDFVNIFQIFDILLDILYAVTTHLLI